MAKSKNHTAHNQTRKAHRNGIKRKARGRVTTSMTGVDAKFRRNNLYARSGSDKARAEEKAKRIEEEKKNPPAMKPIRPRPKEPSVPTPVPPAKPRAPKAPPKAVTPGPDVTMKDPAPATGATRDVVMAQPTGGYNTSSTYLGVPVLVGVPPESLKDYDPASDVATLKKSLKGTGAADISAVFEVLATKSPIQIPVLNAYFLAKEGKTLEKTIHDSTSGPYRDILLALAKDPVDYDAWIVYKAGAGKVGTEETTFNEILIGRTKPELDLLRISYKKLFPGRDLDFDVGDELSRKTKIGFEIALEGRYDNLTPGTGVTVAKDAEALNKAMTKGKDTDQIAVCSILLCRSPDYIGELAKAFFTITKKQLRDVVIDRFGGHMEEFLVHAIDSADSIPRDVKLIEKSFAGFLGTDEFALSYRIIRARYNKARFALIKEAYSKIHKKALNVKVENKTAGPSGRVLVALCG